MPKNWVEWAQLAGAIISIVVALIVVPMWSLLKKIATNHLAHLDEKLDRNKEATEAVGGKVDAVEKKVDGHIQWHLDQKR